MGLELADIFRDYGDAYRQKNAEHLRDSQRQVMRAIERCRTEALGGQIYRCPDCEQQSYSYHSCRNRHCPKCQHERTEEWLNLQRELLLPVAYFMLTFTIPAELHAIARQNPKLIYNLLFCASAEASQKLARDPRFVGGQIGLVGVLHTWTRQLAYHPHVHYLAPGGGLASDGATWLPARNNFFLPVRALSKLFRAAFRRRLQKTALFAQVSPEVWKKDWVVHCKPVGNGQAALKYLAPYIYRVAISNRRLISIEQRGGLETSQVTFQYRTSDTGQIKFCTLSVENFIERFLQHVLPHAFVKVRYYGFFGATVRAKLIALQRSFGTDACTKAEPLPEVAKTTDQVETRLKILCPLCGKTMLFQHAIPPTFCRSP